MNTIDLKEQVRRALAQEWPAFVSAHPRLAAAMDETLLVEPALQSLADDPEFQETMQTAAEVGAAAEVIGHVVLKVVRNWLKQLI
jgi:hypothetical protein